MRSTHIVASSRNLDYCLCGLFLDFRSGGRNRCRRTMVPCFELRLGKDNIWIRFVNKPCTTTAYPHCHLDSLSSVRMLWSAEMTSADHNILGGWEGGGITSSLHSSRTGGAPSCVPWSPGSRPQGERIASSLHSSRNGGAPSCAPWSPGSRPQGERIASSLHSSRNGGLHHVLRQGERIGERIASSLHS